MNLNKLFGGGQCEDDLNKILDDIKEKNVELNKIDIHAQREEAIKLFNKIKALHEKGSTGIPTEECNKIKPLIEVEYQYALKKIAPITKWYYKPTKAMANNPGLTIGLGALGFGGLLSCGCFIFILLLCISLSLYFMLGSKDKKKSKKN